MVAVKTLLNFNCFAFKSDQIKYYLKIFNPHGDSDLHNILPLFINRTYNMVTFFPVPFTLCVTLIFL